MTAAMRGARMFHDRRRQRRLRDFVMNMNRMTRMIPTMALFLLGVLLSWASTPATTAAASTAAAAPVAAAATAAATQANHVLLFVLEGVGDDVMASEAMPTLRELAADGAVAREARSVSPPLTVPAMASLLTGLPVARHRVDRAWETYDFSRSFLRSPTLFDYLDLAGGVDTALFIMDERLYQLARPEIYVDLQTCGKAKPQCTPSTLAAYIADYLRKVTSEGGYNFRIFDIPGLLVAHLPAPADAARKHGRDGPPFRAALRAVDTAMADVLARYRDHGVLDRTMVIVTSLYSMAPSAAAADTARPAAAPSTSGAVADGATAATDADVFWLASGANVKPGYVISRPVNIMDTGATVMNALGLETHTEWDSRALTDIFRATPERRTTGNEHVASH